MFYSAKSGCIRVILVVFGQGGIFRAKWLYSGKSCCIRGKSGFIRQKWLYSDNVVVFGFQCCIRAKIGCIRTKRFYFGKNGCYLCKSSCFRE